MAMSDRTWLYLEETGGYFHCPDGAVDAWKARGWVEADEPPAAPDNTKDEAMLAAARAAEQAAAPAAPADEEQVKPARASRTPQAAATEEKE